MDRLQSYLLLRETLQPASPVSLLCDTLIAALASA